VKRGRAAIARDLVRLLPGVGPALVRAGRALGVLARRAPEAQVWTAGDPIEQARAVARTEEEGLLGAAIALTLALHEDTFLAEEPRVLTLRGSQRSASNWWQTRLSPSSLPPRRVGPPVHPDIFRIPEPGVEPPEQGTATGPEGAV